MDQEKAKWDIDSTRVLINACIEQIYAKQRRGSSFTVDGWKAIVSTFQSSTGKSYDKKQLKNRLESLKKEWTTWDNLFSRETGLGRDPVTNTVLASDEWWARKIQENPGYKKYKYRGLMFETELNFIFKDAVASGEYMVAPSSTQPPQHGVDYDDVYIPIADQQEQEEGSGDSEDENFDANLRGSTGVTGDMADINLTENTIPSGPTSSGSRGKRKIGECSVKRKKQKIAPSKQIADAVSVMAAASQDRNSALREINQVTDAATLEVVQELITIDEIINDESLRNRCITLMMDKTCRDMFLSLKSNRQFLVSWLKDIAYDERFSKPPPAP